MKNNRFKNNKNGFTLVETMFAVFILATTIVSLMTVLSNSLFASRYARDEITVNYLMQEVVDYIRNDRDTMVFYHGAEWKDFADKYTGICTERAGCYMDVLSKTGPKPCSLGDGCPFFYYDKDADKTPYYVSDDGANMSGKLKTNFQRKIVVKQDDKNRDEVNIIVTIYWKNGNLPMSRSLNSSVLKWQ